MDEIELTFDADPFKNSITSLSDSIGTLNKSIETMNSGLSNGINSVKDSMGGITQSIGDVVNSTKNSMDSVYGNLDSVKNSIKGISDTTDQSVLNMINGINSGVDSTQMAMLNLSDILDTVDQSTESIPDNIRDSMDAALSVMNDGTKTINDSINGLKESISDVNDTISKTGDTANESVNGLKSGMDGVKSSVTDTKESSEGLAGGIKKIARNTEKFGLSLRNVLGILGPIMIAFGVIRSVLNEIPEIGVTFKIVGDIIKKNLLWPLRTVLLPLLQKLIDWTKNNRSFFVKFGAVIANVFKAVITIAKSSIGLLTKLFNGLKKGFAGFFNITLDNILEKINILMFKVAAFAIFLEMKFGGVFEGIGEMVSNFAAGFLEGMGDISDYTDSIDSLTKSMAELGKVFGDPELGKGIKAFGKVLGKAFSVSLKNTISSIKDAVDLLVVAIKALSGEASVGEVFDVTAGAVKNVAKRTPPGMLIDMLTGGWDKKKAKVKDAIITKDGKVIETSPDDTIIATKTPGKTNSVDIGGLVVNLNISGGIDQSNAGQVGSVVGESIIQTIKNQLLNQLVAVGGR